MATITFTRAQGMGKHREYLDNKPDIDIFWQASLDVNPSKEVRFLAPIPNQHTRSIPQTTQSMEGNPGQPIRRTSLGLRDNHSGLRIGLRLSITRHRSDIGPIGSMKKSK